MNGIYAKLCAMLADSSRTAIDKASTPTRKGVYITVWKGLTMTVFFVGTNEDAYPIVEIIGP